MTASHHPPWAIRPVTPEPVYTDREEPLAYLHRAALEAIRRRSMSTVLLGRRRMGKTEIFKRVVNRLFFGQERRADPPRRWFRSISNLRTPSKTAGISPKST